MPEEIKYVKYLKKHYDFELFSKNRFRLGKVFESELKTRCTALGGKPEIFTFKTLKNIEDPDEKQESLHSIRLMLTRLMIEDIPFREMARVARSASTRAYAGHGAGLRKIFNLKSLNLTEYARSFALYKTVAEVMAKPKLDKFKEKDP
jgi:hypothetical protein